MMTAALPDEEARFMAVPSGRSLLVIRLDVIGRPNCICVMGAEEAAAQRLLSEEESDARQSFVEWLEKQRTS